MDRREKEMDRKNKHCRRTEDYHNPGGLREDKQCSGEVYRVWDN